MHFDECIELHIPAWHLKVLIHILLVCFRKKPYHMDHLMQHALSFPDKLDCYFFDAFAQKRKLTQ